MSLLEVQENDGWNGTAGILLKSNCLMCAIIFIYDTANNWTGRVVRRPPINISLALPGKGSHYFLTVFMCIAIMQACSPLF